MASTALEFCGLHELDQDLLLGSGTYLSEPLKAGKSHGWLSFRRAPTAPHLWEEDHWAEQLGKS